jgi:hypothetical protein
MIRALSPGETRSIFPELTLKKTLLLASLFLLAFGARAAGVPAADDDEEDDPVQEAMTLYLVSAEPEACAQIYPELRRDVDKYRAGIAGQMKGGAASRAERQLPIEAEKEISACLRKQVALSKTQCGRLIGSLSAPPQENVTEAALEKRYHELHQLMTAGRAMIEGCADKVEKDLRKKYSRSR